MKLSRRSFLVSLSAAVAALTLKTLDPEIPILQGLYAPERLLWTPDDAREIVLPPRVARASDCSLTRMTSTVLRLLEQELPGFRALQAPARGRWGDTVMVREDRPFLVTRASVDLNADITMTIRPVLLSEIRSFEVVQPSLEAWVRAHRNYPDFEHAELRMVARDFARTIRRARLNVFGEQDLLMVGEAARARGDRSGLAVRGVKYYDCPSYQFRVRFDILGGHA